MSKTSDRFQWLAREFELLAENLENCPNLEKRKQLLRRMKILIDEIDTQILFIMKRDAQKTSSLPPLDQPAAKP